MEQVASPQEAFNPLAWVQVLCAQTGDDPKSIPAEVLKVMEAADTKNKLNELYFSWRSQFLAQHKVELSAADRELFTKIITVKNHPEYQEATLKIQRIRQDVDTYHNRIRDNLRAMQPWIDKLNALDVKTEMDLYPMVEQVIADGWYKFNAADTIDKLKRGSRVFMFETPDVVLGFFNRKAGISKSLNMGRFSVEWRIAENCIIVGMLERNVEVSNHIHPHVASSGSVCWGNAAQVYSQGMMYKDPVEAMRALRVILTTYNAESPYVSIESFEEQFKQDQQSSRETEFIPLTKHYWIHPDYMPESWAKEHEIDEGEDDNGETVYQMRVFGKFYVDTGERVIGNVVYVRTRNGRNFSVDVDDIELV